MMIISLVVLALLSMLLLLCLFNKYLPVWFCDHMGWHFPKEKQGFDGCSFTATCARCEKPILQDSQGNWFTSD